MSRIMLLFVMVSLHQAAFATVYKCKTGAGKIEYQELPCANSSNVTQSTLTPLPSPSTQSPATVEGKKECTKKGLSINFPNAPLFTTLHVIADYSGNKLSISPAIGRTVGTFHYVCTSWESVLNDIALKYNLVIVVEGGTIIVRPH